MSKKDGHIWTRLALISGFIVFFDQISKYIIKINLDVYDNIIVINNFFNITHILNPGGAFGFFASSSPELRKFIFLFVSSIVALFILWFYKKSADSYIFLSHGFAMIFGGAVGNLIDRFRYGKVVDFLDFYIGTYHWPAFNIADSAISIGMAILIYHIIFKKIPDF
ncbi:MAG: signal peptidase II [Desulfobacula sp.]|nr:signal peptidase II [Desulfobacula sp.]